MSQRLVALDDVLGALTEAGPLSTDAVARELKLSRLDARLVLVDAHAHGLVRRNSRGEWTLSDLGQQALTAELEDRGDDGRAEDDRWSIAASLHRLATSRGLARWVAALHPRYLARRGIPLAMGAIVCAGGVAVASSRLEGAEGPPVVTTHVKARTHRRQGHTGAVRSVASPVSTRFQRRRRATLLARTTVVHHKSVPVVSQNRRRLATRCTQRHQVHGRVVGANGTCVGGRQGISRSGGGGSRSGVRRRHPVTAGPGSNVAIWPPAASAGT
jgi:hypothetical protein